MPSTTTDRRLNDLEVEAQSYQRRTGCTDMARMNYLVGLMRGELRSKQAVIDALREQMPMEMAE